MYDYIIEHWNGVATVLSLVIAFCVLGLRIHESRAQEPDLEILNSTGLDNKMGPPDDPRAGSPVSNYRVKLRVQNCGREATTISEVKIRYPSTGNEVHIEGDEVEIDITGYDDLPSFNGTDSGVRIPGNGIVSIEYEFAGTSPNQGAIDVDVEVESVDGDICEDRLTLPAWDPQNNDLLP